MPGHTMPARVLLAALLASAAAGPSAQPRTFTGTIIDDTCARGGHAAMRMGPTDAECTRLCVSLHDGAYVLLSGDEVYALSNQQLPEAFAAQEVVVTGDLDRDAKTIRVESIKAAS